MDLTEKILELKRKNNLSTQIKSEIYPKDLDLAFYKWVEQESKPHKVVKTLVCEFIFHWQMEGIHHETANPLAYDQFENFAKDRKVSPDGLANSLRDIWNFLITHWLQSKPFLKSVDIHYTPEAVASLDFFQNKLINLERPGPELEKLVLICRGALQVPGKHKELSSLDLTKDVAKALIEAYQFLINNWNGIRPYFISE